MSFTSEFQDALEAMETILGPSETPAQITWLGQTFDCIYSTHRRAANPSVGGYEIEYSATVLIRRELVDAVVGSSGITADSTLVTVDTILTTADGGAGSVGTPSSGQKITKSSTQYRVAEVFLTGVESHYVLKLIDPNM